MEPVSAQVQLGFAHFIAQSDGLAKFLIVVLLAMSAYRPLNNTATRPAAA